MIRIQKNHNFFRYFIKSFPKFFQFFFSGHLGTLRYLPMDNLLYLYLIFISVIGLYFLYKSKKKRTEHCILFLKLMNFWRRKKINPDNRTCLNILEIDKMETFCNVGWLFASQSRLSVDFVVVQRPSQMINIVSLAN